MSINLNDVLASTGGKTLKPETVGETLGGTIVTAEVRQATDYMTGEPKFWDDGKPQNQIVITLATGAKTDDGEDEQGSVYIKTWGDQKASLMEAIKATGLDANSALAPGNRFAVTLTGEKPNEKNPRLNATKLYQYQITPQANLSGALDQPQQAPQAPVQTQAPAAPAPTQEDDPIATARQLIAAGLDDQTIATATGLDPAVITALRGV